jgi:histidyl-tRNA synthetase
MAPVWRAERPQKGRYRQFVQCDIDIIGDATGRAEAELLVASLDALDALGLVGGSIRINDRRVLDWMLGSFGFAAEERAGVLITIDKLDKIGAEGVAAELASGAPRRTPSTPSTRSCVDRGVSTVRTEGRSEGAARGAPATSWPTSWRSARRCRRPAGLCGRRAGRAARVRSVPRARDGYYTGTIFELAHPSVTYSLGGGRYDGMIGRFLGQQVPAVGFSSASSASSTSWRMPTTRACRPSSSCTSATCRWGAPRAQGRRPRRRGCVWSSARRT